MARCRNVNSAAALMIISVSLLFSTSSFPFLNHAYAISASFSLTAIENTTTIMAASSTIQKSISIIANDNASDTRICHVAINPTTGRFYITTTDGSLYAMKQQSGNITGVAGESNHKISNSPLMQLSTINLGVGSCASEMAINTRSNMIYVPNVITDSLYVIDGQSNKVIKQISLVGDNQTLPSQQLFLASNIISMGINSLSNKIYVNFGIPTVTEEKGSDGNAPTTVYSYVYKTYEIDGNTNTILDENLTGVERGQNDIAVDSELGKVYFTHYDVYNYSHSITIMKEDGSSNSNHTLGIIKRIQNLTGDAQSMAVNPATHRIYVDTFGISSHKNIINVIDGKTDRIISSITLSNGTEGLKVYAFPAEGDGKWMDIAVNPNTNTIYATNMFLGTLYVIDGSTDKLSYRIETPADSSQSSFSKGAFTAPVQVASDYSSDGVYIVHANSKAISLIGGPEDMPEFSFAVMGVAAAVAVSIGIFIARSGRHHFPPFRSRQ